MNPDSLHPAPVAHPTNFFFVRVEFAEGDDHKNYPDETYVVCAQNLPKAIELVFDLYYEYYVKDSPSYSGALRPIEYVTALPWTPPAEGEAFSV